MKILIDENSEQMPYIKDGNEFHSYDNEVYSSILRDSRYPELDKEAYEDSIAIEDTITSSKL